MATPKFAFFDTSVPLPVSDPACKSNATALVLESASTVTPGAKINVPPDCVRPAVPSILIKLLTFSVPPSPSRILLLPDAWIAPFGGDRELFTQREGPPGEA